MKRIRIVLEAELEPGDCELKEMATMLREIVSACWVVPVYLAMEVVSREKTITTTDLSLMGAMMLGEAV